MSLSAVSGVSPVQAIYWPGVVTPVPAIQQGSQASRSGSATPRTADDTYTPGSLLGGQGAALLNGIPQSLLYGLSSSGLSSSGLTSSSLQTQTGTAAPMGALLSGLSAAISTAAQDGTEDSNWVDDLVSFASGLGAGAGTARSSPVAASGSPSAGGALASDLNTIGAVIQQLTAQVTSALASQGASANQVSAAVQALTTSLTLNSLGAVAQQIAAQAGSKNTFTVTSSVVTVSTNGSSASVSQAGEVERIAGANTSLALTTTGGSASLAAAGEAAGSAAGLGAPGLTAQGFGYTFSIAENGPDGSVFAGTSEASASAELDASNGSGQSVEASAALAQSTTVYESASGAGGSSNALVLLSDWEASLETTATQQSAEATDAQEAQPAPTATTAAATASAPAAASAPASAPSLADSLNAAAHALFNHALALLQAIFGWADGNSAGNAAQSSRVDVYA